MTLLLCIFFFFSGASALVFESLMFRQAGLAFGNSVWATTLVLSGFMGGLALGNALAAKWGDRFKNPILTYAWIEGAIGITGVLLVFLLPQIGAILAPLFSGFIDSPWILNPLRLIFAFLLLLIPSTAMGLTLPLLTKALVANHLNFGRALGSLYGWNTLGAVSGVLLPEMVLIGKIGIHGTALTAGIVNLLIAAAALGLSMTTVSPAPAVPELPLRFRDWKRGRRLLVAAFLCGFCLLALEVIWFRFLLLYVNGYSESFALMLAIVLSGIALGGLGASFLLRFTPEGISGTPGLAFLAGLFCIGGYAAFPDLVLPYGGEPISHAGGILATGLPLMFPVSFVSGALFTLIGTALRNHLVYSAGTTGALTFANTTGAAAGSFTGGFFLLPVLGMERSFFLIALLYGGIGLILTAGDSRGRRTALAGAVLFGAGLFFFPFGAMKAKNIMVPIQRFLSPDGRGIAGIREGLLETSIYIENTWAGKPLYHRLVTNSYSMSASNLQARRYMKLYVYWPLALHPDPKKALLISYGVGNTAKAMTDSKVLESIHIVDISRDIVEMNDIVYPEKSDRPLSDPRTRLHIEDGRYFLQTTREHFDLITGEPPPPEMAGVVNLYSREYFELIHGRLAEGGMVTYWLPTHTLTGSSTRAILRAFCDAFPDCSLWHGQGPNFMMVGTRNARGPVPDFVFRRQWEDPDVFREMEALGFEHPEQLGALYIGGADYLKALTRDTPALTDNFPKRVSGFRGTEDEMSRLLSEWTSASKARARFEKDPLVDRLWPDAMKTATLPWFDIQQIINIQWFSPGVFQKPLIRDVHRLLTQTDLRTLPMILLGSNPDILRIIDTAYTEEEPVPQIRIHQGIREMVNRNYAAARRHFAVAEQHPSTQRNAFRYTVFALCMEGKTKTAEKLARENLANYLAEKREQDIDRGLTPQPPGAFILPPFWAWMKETFGIDPRPNSQSEIHN